MSFLSTLGFSWLSSQRGVSSGGGGTDPLPSVPSLYQDSITGTGLFQFNMAGTWFTITKPEVTGGTAKGSNTENSTITFSWQGTKLDVLAEYWPNHGLAEVTTDGGTPAIVDLYAAAPVNDGTNGIQVYTTGDLANGNHTTVVKVLNQKNALATDTYVVIDAFRVWKPEAFSAKYFVGGTGASDLNDGLTISTPFATIPKAASLAIAGDVVAIRSGVYRYTTTPTNSGTVSSRIRYVAYPGDIVIVSGLNTIADNLWTLHSGNIYKCTISLPLSGLFNEVSSGNTSLLANQIFQNGEMQHLARYPKVSSMDDLFDRTKFLTRSQTTTFNDTTLVTAALPAIGSYIGAWISMSGWIITQTRQITAHSGNTYNYAQTIVVNGDGFRQFFYMTGKLGLLTQAKEWHYESGVLYLWQQGGGSPISVEYKARNWGFDLRGKANISIEGIRFVGCDPFETDSSSVNTIMDNCRISYSNHNFLQMLPGANYFKSAKQVGAKLYGAGSIIKNCEFQYAGAQGTWLSSNCRLENNLFTHMAYDGMWGSAAMPVVGSTTGIVITRNTMRKLGRSGINLADNGSARSNMDISYNDISDHTRLNLDNGAIYNGINTSTPNLRIHHNWFYKIGQQFLEASAPGVSVTGAYFDQASGPVILDHNVQWGPHAPGTGCDFYTEQANGSPPGPQTHRLYNNTMMSSPVYACYISWNNTQKDIQRNNIYGTPNNLAQGANPGDFANCLFYNQNPLFVGGDINVLKGLVYQIQSGSPARNTGTILAPYTDGYLETAPDIGAYEFGSTSPWVPGYVAVPYTP